MRCRRGSSSTGGRWRSRAHDREDLAELVRDVVVDQVAVLLGRDPEEIDPTG